MREVIIQVECDVCRSLLEEPSEGHNLVHITFQGRELEMDMCDECVHGSFLQEARPVSKKTSKTFLCAVCDKSFATQVGLKRHAAQKH